MLQVVNGVDQVVSEKLNEAAMEFFALSSAKLAHIHLNSLLEKENIRVSRSPALANHLWSGSFLWTNHVTPSGLAILVFTSESYLKTDIMKQALVLECSTKFNYSEEDVTKLTETMIIFPNSVEELTERLKALLVISSFLFEETKMLPQAAKKLVNWCTDNRSLLEARAASDKFYLTMLTLAIDERIYLWLKSCCKAVNVTSTAVSFMNFTTITSSIELNNFHYAVPSSVKAFRPKSSNENKEDS